MSRIDTVLRVLGEVAHLSTLRSFGLADDEVRAAARRGAVIRVRPGWYASRRADAEQLVAVRVHAKLGCATALQRFGVWSGPAGPVHLHVPTNASRLGSPGAPGSPGASTGREVPSVWHPRTPDDRRRGIRPGDRSVAPTTHWLDDPDAHAALDWICSPSAALAQAVRCLPTEHAQAAVDSMVAERGMPRSDVERIVALAPARLGLVVDELSGRVGSGVESLFARRLVARGHRVESQVGLGPHGPFDGVIDGCVLYEADGWRHHASRESFEADRGRTLVAQSFGMPLVRPSAAQVLEDWPLVLAAVERTVADASRLRGLDGWPSR
ncbi:hypothetical protein [Agromyces marinus]|uniref:DUF559 domain-containing protein n=1 Tax=Agromyces marinus TaxID=1389020 RepID=A0ABN6YA20_9MICO|nr:hypothetical protein [Agromyces marinus]UIP57873.1 hypothetical protein DSM26151_07390 [Agromyces marinus]BDZ53934.1 hypothetical protein GCM10025870_10070 [Agromyces marinus]